jgi:hypothetical protein
MDDEPVSTNPTAESAGDALGRTSRRRFSWKSVLLAAGGLSVCAVAAVVFLLAYTYSAIRPGAMSFADDTIRTVFTSWDVSAYSSRASPELLQAAPTDQITPLFTKLSDTLGALRTYEGVQSGSVNRPLTGPVDATASFVVTAQYEKGPATIRLEALRRDNRWQLTSWNVNSPALSLR